MRFHVVSLPHTQTTLEFSMCAYTEKVRKFCLMMKSLGHEVYLYAGEQNEAPCDELITCITEAERLMALDGRPYIYGSFDYTLPHWVSFNRAAAEGIMARYQPRDFVCVVAGVAHQPVVSLLKNVDLAVVEFGIGYGGTFANYRVWESYAWMHTVYGSHALAGNPHNLEGYWYDAVIPNSFDVKQFPFAETKGDYYLFMGRLAINSRKGPHIASEVCQRLGARLLIAGEGVPPAYGEYIGTVGPERRGSLMSRAKAIFVPTTYIEPFGGVAIEAMICGTPVISTDWGAFTETVQNGLNGYRCRSLKEFMTAAEEAPKLNTASIRERAIAKYSLETVSLEYQAYFERLTTLWADGWYAS